MDFLKGTLSTVRDLNRTNVLEIVKKYEPISRASIAKMLKMSRSVISEIVEQLLVEGLIAERGIGESTPQGGRRPVQLYFVASAKYALGLDIGGTKTIVMLTDLNGNVVARKKFSSHHNLLNPFLHIAQETQNFLDDSGIERQKIVGTGIGVPSITNNRTGELIYAPGLHLNNVNVRQYFATTLPGPILVDNDVNMGVIGERWKGHGVGYNNVVLLAIGTGVGAGIIVNGEVHRGANGFAGEIGYLQVDPLVENPDVQVSNFGPFERVASGKGIENQVRHFADKFPNTMLDLPNVTAEQVFAAASVGDPLAMFVVDLATKYIASAVVNIITLLNPDVVIIGGGVAQVGEAFLASVRRRATAQIPIPFRLVGAGLGEDAGAFGAAATALLETGNLKSF